jgi:hypothetical protein
MKFSSYNKEIRNATAQLLDAFDNIEIIRTANIGGTQKTLVITVPCVYGPRTRIIKNLEDRNKTLKLPITSVSLMGYARDAGRAHSVNNVLELQPGGQGGINLMHNVATPIVITYELTAVAKYMSDLEQIVQNFIAIMNPDIYVTWENPQGSGNLKTHVVWDGNIAIQNAEDISKDAPWRVSATTNFVVRTWIFPGREPYDTNLDSRIRKINFCNNYESDYFPDLDGDGFPDDGDGVSLPVVFSKWYDNRTYGASMDEFYDKIKSGLILSPNYDWLPILDDLSGSYWSNEMYGILSGNFYDFSVSGDLETLIENENNPDLLIGYIRDEGNIFIPDHLQLSAGYADWSSLWRRMLSGDLRCVSATYVSGSDVYKYLLKEDSYIYLLYEDNLLIPIIT